MDAGGRSCGNYLRIARSILKHINESTLVSGDGGQKLVVDMLGTFFNAVRRNGVFKLSGQIEYVFELLSLVIDDWGIECREVILQHCIPFASSFVEKLNFSSAAINDLMITEWNLAEGIDCNDRPHFVVSCLSLGCEITSRWSHRIDPHRLTCMATKLWDARSLIKL
ncbi:hypothetical protein ANCDUO_08852 [Ancylostoma duodenale]|uniref:Uncharacterized protein n=1 Tax=Ancylostoma duodenale TaxID=51022 RepID=A0A0C2CVI1_9BILA|nr:hypothetical protein ANCDUO_08852 [Ancylostoma duodenale]